MLKQATAAKVLTDEQVHSVGINREWRNAVLDVEDGKRAVFLAVKETGTLVTGTTRGVAIWRIDKGVV